MDQTMTPDTAPTTDGVRFPEQELKHLRTFLASEGHSLAAGIVRDAIQARNDELIASREVIADLRGQLGKLREERDQWRIIAKTLGDAAEKTPMNDRVHVGCPVCGGCQDTKTMIHEPGCANAPVLPEGDRANSPPHDWLRGWPGNFCKRCGMDDPVEAAIVCSDCHVPCDEYEADQTMRLCAEHDRLVHTPCVVAPSDTLTPAPPSTPSAPATP